MCSLGFGIAPGTFAETQRALHHEVPVFKIQIAPAQCEQLTKTHATGDRQYIERFQSIALRLLKKAAHLLWGERLHLRTARSRRCCQRGDIPLHETHCECVMESFVDRRM